MYQLRIYTVRTADAAQISGPDLGKQQRVRRQGLGPRTRGLRVR